MLIKEKYRKINIEIGSHVIAKMRLREILFLEVLIDILNRYNRR
jgi:hypothetical protein